MLALALLLVSLASQDVVWPSVFAQEDPAGLLPTLIPPQVAKQAFLSVVMVSVSAKRGQPLAIGSGVREKPR